MAKKRKINTEPFVLPGLVGILIFVVLPLIDVIVRSFRLGGMGRFVGWGNYKTVTSNEAFLLATKNNLLFLVISVTLLMLFSLFISIEVHNMKSNLIRFAFLIPLAIPSNAMAVVWKMLFSEKGIINNILVQILHLSPINFFEGTAVFALFVATFVFKNIGYNMLIWISGLSAIPKEIYDAAKVDGAGRFRTVWHITLPNIRRTAFITAILSMVNSFKIFRELYLIAGSYPNMNIYQLQHVFNNWFLKLDVSKLTAGAVLTAITFLAIIIVISLLVLTEWKDLLRYIKKKKLKKIKTVDGMDNKMVRSEEGERLHNEKKDK